MVRLVFRPYTQVRRTICTSVSLRASTRVSPGFTLLGIVHHLSGPAECSDSNLPQVRSVDGALVTFLPQQLSCLHFHFASGFSTQILAYMLDSLVRVSRRVTEYHFIRIPNGFYSSSHVSHLITNTTSCPRRHANGQGPQTKVVQHFVTSVRPRHYSHSFYLSCPK